MSGLHFSPREKSIFWAFLLVCAVYGLYGGLYRPAMERSGQIEIEIAQTQKKISEQARLIRQARDLTAKFPGDWSSYSQIVSNEQAMAAVLSEIENTVNHLNVQIAEMKPQGVVKDKLFNKFSVSLKVNGDLRDILRFIHGLQGQSNNLMVSEFYMEKSSQNENAIMARLVISRVFIL